MEAPAAKKPSDLVRLGPLAEAVRTIARQLGTSPTVFVRQAVARALEVPTPAGRAPRSARAGAATQRVRMRFTVAEQEALQAGAGRSGLDVQAYLAALVLADQAGATVEAMRALAIELRKGNSTLGHIGVNLNQLTRKMNVYPGQTTKAEREQLAEAARAVKSYMVLGSRVVGSLGPFARYDSQGRFPEE